MGNGPVTGCEQLPTKDIMPLVTAGDKGNTELCSKHCHSECLYVGILSSADVDKKSAAAE